MKNNTTIITYEEGLERERIRREDAARREHAEAERLEREKTAAHDLAMLREHQAESERLLLATGSTRPLSPAPYGSVYPRHYWNGTFFEHIRTPAPQHRRDKPLPPLPAENAVAEESHPTQSGEISDLRRSNSSSSTRPSPVTWSNARSHHSREVYLYRDALDPAARVEYDRRCRERAWRADGALADLQSEENYRNGPPSSRRYYSERSHPGLNERLFSLSSATLVSRPSTRGRPSTDRMPSSTTHKNYSLPDLVLPQIPPLALKKPSLVKRFTSRLRAISSAHNTKKI